MAHGPGEGLRTPSFPPRISQSRAVSCYIFIRLIAFSSNPCAATVSHGLTLPRLLFFPPRSFSVPLTRPERGSNRTSHGDATLIARHRRKLKAPLRRRTRARYLRGGTSRERRSLAPSGERIRREATRPERLRARFTGTLGRCPSGINCAFATFGSCNFHHATQIYFSRVKLDLLEQSH